MNLLLTGGTGFFGKALLRYWANNKNPWNKITIISRNPQKFITENPGILRNLSIDFIESDIINLDKIEINNRFDCALIAATDSTNGPKLSSFDLYNQIVEGTKKTIEFAIKYGVSRVLLTSSGAVYGPQPENIEFIDETYLGCADISKKENAYSIGKLVTEHLIVQYAEKFGIEHCIARCFAFVGEDLPLDSHFAIGNFINDALHNRTIIIKGNGSQVRSYMHQDDLSKWLSNMLASFGVCGIYNVGSEEAISLKDLADLICSIYGKDLDYKILGRPNPNDFKNRYVPSIKKAMSAFKNEVPISLEESLRKML